MILVKRRKRKSMLQKNIAFYVCGKLVNSKIFLRLTLSVSFIFHNSIEIPNSVFAFTSKKLNFRKSKLFFLCQWNLLKCLELPTHIANRSTDPILQMFRASARLKCSFSNFLFRPMKDWRNLCSGGFCSFQCKIRNHK